MIRRAGDVFVLTTPGSAYALQVTDTGHLEHLYYGPALGWDGDTPEEWLLADCAALAQRREFEVGNAIAYDSQHKNRNLEDLPQEISTQGKGDLREPFLMLRRSDGSATADFRFRSCEILEGVKDPIPGLPSARAEEGEADQLRLVLEDGELTLHLTYWAFRDLDVICRTASIENTGDAPVTVEKLMSTQLDLPGGDWQMTMFHGAWAREMEKETVPVRHGRVVCCATTGTSSNRMNPYVILHRPETSEDAGACYGLNLVYSGNHYTSAAVNAWEKTRVLQGINPETFSWHLEPGEEFRAPEAVMAFSGRGFGGLSRTMADFIRNHIVRGTWANRPRPVLLNSWEAAYFDIDEGKLLKLSRAAADVGIELMVLDDGWFGSRSDDSRALGDWDMNKKKFPGGLNLLTSKVRAQGLDFGIWIEPEMVNMDSDLYRAHPDWTLDIPGRDHSEGRNQRILDLANPAVVAHLKERIGGLLSSGAISYVKWDMNRNFSDIFSRALPANRQGEVAHRYVLGLYDLMEDLTCRFPKVLFEGCASGGNRFDLGILCYFPQIWASDNTDALCRTGIQEGYSYGYPMNTVTAHVSASPNHQTLRRTTLATRFHVAMFGTLGYELNLPDLSRGELEEIRGQVALYKQWREVLQFGDFYRLETGNVHKWICVSRDKKRAVGLLLRELAVPNSQEEIFRAKGLEPGLRYRLYSLPHTFDLRIFGGLVNTISPIHIRQDSLTHQVLAKFKPMNGEVEDLTVSGALLMEAGVQLSPAYGGTGFNENTRAFPDFSSRVYFMEAVE